MVAFISGTYHLSSNRFSKDLFGGRGWIAGPEGTLLARTSRETPIITMDLPLSVVEEAKKSYPRYVIEDE